MLTPEEMAIADKRTEKKIFLFISTLKWASETKTKHELKISGLNSLVQPVSCCTVQGSGLKAGVVGRKMKFSVSISNVFGMVDLFLQLKGPRNEVYSEKIVSLHQSSDSILKKNRNKVVKRVNADHKVTQGDARVLAYIEDGHGNTYVRWKNVIQYGAHAIYNAFDFNCTCSKEGSFVMSFVPVSAGIHTLSIRWQEKHVDGSPFKVKVYKLSDVSRRNLMETKDKRMLFDSLSMSLDCNSDAKKQPNTKFEDKTEQQQRIRKQYTITKRRILKKVIAKNGEEIIITETPTPPYSRQSSMTDISDYTDDDGSSCRRSRSSSPALLRAANDLVNQSRSRSSSPGVDKKRNSKGPKMASISERSTLNVKPSNLSSQTSSPATTDLESIHSTDSDVIGLFNKNKTERKIENMFFDTSLQNFVHQEYGIPRQNSDSATSKINCNVQNKSGEGMRSRRLSFLNRSLSEPSLEGRILKSLIGNLKENSAFRETFAQDSPRCQTNSPTLKMLKSASLRKACFYISEKAIDQSQSLVSSDSQIDAYPASPFSHNNQQEINAQNDDTYKIPKNKNNEKMECSDLYKDDFKTTDKNKEDSRDRPVFLNNIRNDKQKVATIADFSRNGTEKSRNEQKQMKINNLKENSAIKNVQDWLTQHHHHSTSTSNQSSDTGSSTSSNGKRQARRTRSSEAEEMQTKSALMRRTKSCDLKRAAFQKQNSIYPEDFDEPNENLDNECGYNEQRLVKAVDCTQTARFRTISENSKVDDISSVNISIVVPKVKCDKGIVVTASEILRETKWEPISSIGSILRRRVCLGSNDKQETKDDETKEDIKLMPDNIVPNHGRSLSIDMGSRERKVRAWIETHPPVRFHGPIRQSTVETMDSGVGDDNGILSSRRASLYSNFRFSDDNHHQALCRRPYKGIIPLDPKLIQSCNNSNDNNNNSVQNESQISRSNSPDDTFDISLIDANRDDLNDSSNYDNRPSFFKTFIQTCSDVFPPDSLAATSLPDSNTILSHDSGMTVLTTLSRTSTPSTPNGDVKNKFGINEENRENLLDQIDLFKHLDSGNRSSLDSEHSVIETERTIYSESSLSPRSKYSSVENDNQSTHDSFDICETENFKESKVLTALSKKFVTSVQVPYFFQINDVIIANNNSECNLQEQFGLEVKVQSVDQNEDFVCKANGLGLEEGHVGVKNNFQVRYFKNV